MQAFSHAVFQLMYDIIGEFHPVVVIGCILGYDIGDIGIIERKWKLPSYIGVYWGIYWEACAFTCFKHNRTQLRSLKAPACSPAHKAVLPGCSRGDAAMSILGFCVFVFARPYARLVQNAPSLEHHD